MHLIPRPALGLVALCLTVVPGLKTIAKAQNLAGLPSCAEPALFASIQGSGCQLTDVKCLCSNQKLFPTLLSAIQQACSPADQAAVEAFGASYCGSVLPSDTLLPGFSGAVTSTLGPAATEVSTTASTTYHKTMTYSTTSTAAPANGTSTGGAMGAMETGLGAAALAAAVVGMQWVFAEL